MNDSVFHRLYDSYHQDVFQFLIYLVKNRQTAEDLVQEVYVRVLRAYSRFEGKSSEKTWLFSIAKNVAIDHFRKQTVRKKRLFESFDWETMQLASSDMLPEDLVQLNDEMRSLLLALDDCTGDQKMVIVMRYFQELSITETAQVLNWSEGKVKTTQHRAIKALRERLSVSDKEGKVHHE
ncbi:RNA polymerase sigma factor SigX [Psychrobacillus vulpis]|uniref:RNA polymerase sigma factor n=1 Tax=Psychrobacillus vulpis TaxID=2325572 RepID=A0A544TUE2_9BACI|nr:RNA polymerase sigma factor SigX [Psychrobacillus vulpis]TQR21078.1 RNA polymerase sigma factor SigX [Psychrobacillus vulpis]